MKRFYEELVALAQAHVPVAVATVIESKGSTPREVGAKMKAVVFLASDDSSYITGTELFMDGGMAQV